MMVFIVVIFLSFSKETVVTDNLDNQLSALLQSQNFTGKMQASLEARLGRKLDMQKVNLGRLIFFDKGLGLHQDNSCAGCHAPSFGFGDSQPIAIGVQNNNIVGEHRQGPRNQRRSPSVINTAFFRALMWNGRFAAPTGDPFSNTAGYIFPSPEGDSLFSASYSYVGRNKHLLVAQAHIPFTELPEMSGFTSTANKVLSFSRFSGLSKENNNQKGKSMDQPLLFSNQSNINAKKPGSTCVEPNFSVFDDGKGMAVPAVDAHYNSANFGIRSVVLTLLNNNAEYRRLFRQIYPEVATSAIDFVMVGEVVAEFEFFLTFAQAPLDKFAVGNKNAMTDAEKKGAIVFFTKGACVSCHSVSGNSNEMFSDFESHNIGVPQIHPHFGVGTGNVPFSSLDCAAKPEKGTLDFGLEEFTGNITDRYKFRSSPLRNVKLQSSFFHNGSFDDLRKAIVFHLDPIKNSKTYSPQLNGVPSDLFYKADDMPDVLKTVDPVLQNGVRLTEEEIQNLYLFVRNALFDEKASPEKMQALIPQKVPSGVPVAFFEKRFLKDDEPTQNIKIAASGMKDVTNENIFHVISYDNPTSGAFRLRLQGVANTSFKLKITDITGHIVEARENLPVGQEIRFGEQYQRGTYFADIQQDGKKISIKLVKM